MVSEDSQWAQMFKHHFFRNGCPIQRHFNTSIWSGVRPHMDLLLDNNIWIVGTIEKIHFWKDNWLGAHLAELVAISPHSSFQGIIDYYYEWPLEYAPIFYEQNGNCAQRC